MLPRSLRWRMLLWLAFLLAGVLGGFGLMVWEGEGDRAMHRLDRDLAAKGADLEELIRQAGGPGGGPYGPPPKPPGSTSQRPGPPDGPGGMRPPPFGRDVPGGPPSAETASKDRVVDEILGIEKQNPRLFAAAYFKKSDEWLVRRGTGIGERIPARVGRESRGHLATFGSDRVFYSYTEMGDAVVVGSGLEEIRREMRAFLWKLVLIASGAFVIGFTGSWVLINRSLRPVELISRSARRVAGGNLSERIEIRNTESEIGRLATVLNTTFSQLEMSFDQQKRFISDASHELRTPLTVLITENQSALSKPRTEDEYRETVEENLKTAIQMKRLAESLLELARLDSNQSHDERISFEIGDLLDACVTKLRLVAEKKGVSIRSRQTGAIMVHASPVRLGLVINNLLENAIHYTDERGEITVTVSASERGCLLEVSDTGCGIKAEHLPHVFERFYRSDASRNRDAGRYGLGLTICKAVVEAEGGGISVSSNFGQGATFTVHLPILISTQEKETG